MSVVDWDSKKEPWRSVGRQWAGVVARLVNGETVTPPSEPYLSTREKKTHCYLGHEKRQMPKGAWYCPTCQAESKRRKRS